MARNPELKFEKGKKYKLTLKDGFEGESYDKRKNDGSMKPWYAFNVKYDDIVYTTFLDRETWLSLNNYGDGTKLEMIDLDESENWWAHRWDIKSIGNSNPLDKQMAESKNETEIKIGVYASMKIAAAVSNNVDELKINTYSVIELHKKIVQEIKNEDDLFNESQDGHQT